MIIIHYFNVMKKFVITEKTAILLLIFSGLILYANSLFNGFVGDDFLQIVHNPSIHSLTNFIQFFTGSTFSSGGANDATGLFYRPLMLIFFSLIYSFSGVNPFFYHFFQLVLHIANAILIFYFLRHILKKNTSSFIVAFLFLIHPINNQAVVYAANLQEALFFFFGMSALLIATKQVTSLRHNTLISLLLFLSLLAKETGILFVFIILVYSHFFQKKKQIFIFIGSFLTILAYALLRFGVANMQEAHGSVAPIYQADVITRLINIPAILWFYITTFFYPSNLSASHYWIIEKISFADFYIPLLGTLIFFVLLISALKHVWKKHKKIYPYVIFFFLWFLSGLVLHLQLYPLDATVADRWFYFPIVGLLSMLGLLYSTLKLKKAHLQLLKVLLLTIVVLFSLRVFIRNIDWKNNLTLYTADYQVTRQNYVLDNAIGTAFIENGEYKKAKPYVTRSVVQYPYYANLNNQAIIATAEKDFDNAKLYLQRAVKISTYATVYENYSSFLLTYDDLTEAEIFTKKSLTTFPRNAKLWLNLAKIYYVQKEYDQAKEAAFTADLIYPTEESIQFLASLSNNTPIKIFRQVK